MRRLSAWLVVAAVVVGCGPEAAFDARTATPGFFAESRFAYQATSILRESTQAEADRLALFGVGDIVKTNVGYLLADSGNDRLLLFDWENNLVRAIGREGSGPGEFQFPTHLDRLGDSVIVLDKALRRVSHFTLDGDFIATAPVWGHAEDIAIHPVLGILVATDVDSGHYLGRLPVDPGDPPTPFAPIPPGLMPEARGQGFQHRTDLVAVTPDGSVHVLAGRHLALASYDQNGTMTSLLYLPKKERAHRMERNQRQVEGLGGPRVVLSSPIVNRLDALEDGRLLATLPRFRTDQAGLIGYVLDVERAEATPLWLPPRLSGMGRPMLDGTWLVLARARTGMAIAEVTLVERDGDGTARDGI